MATTTELPFRRDDWMLRADVAHLNHGSYGAVPRPVFAEYQRLQVEAEENPLDFFLRRSHELLKNARTEVGAFLGSPADDIVFFENSTTAVNVVARSLPLSAGDEILLTDHEYGAIQRIWKFIAKKRGAVCRSVKLPLPFGNTQQILDAFEKERTASTKVICIDHIISLSAAIIPVKEICDYARSQGIWSVVDGAHAPGQIPFSLKDIGADFYAGNFHKWLSAPKGSAFLYVRPECQSLIEPLVVSWGWESLHPSSSKFQDYLEWRGTRDLSAFLAVPAALQFWKSRPADETKKLCHAEVVRLESELRKLTKTESLYSNSNCFRQMATVKLPKGYNAEDIRKRLFENHKVEVFTNDFEGHMYLRVSVQEYNSPADSERLLAAMRDILK